MFGLIGFKNEIVTFVDREYMGTASGYEEEPLLW